MADEPTVDSEPSLEIEMSYDPEIVQHPEEEADTRWVKVEIENQKIKPGTVSLGPPEKSPDAFCPIQIKAGTETTVGQSIEFRAELTAESLKRFSSSEAAATQEYPILIKAQVDDHRRKPRFAKRRAVVRINLSRIHWEWKPLLRDENRRVTDDGPLPLPNTAIEVKVDGTDKHGFSLYLKREERQKDGSYKRADSDFVHYLSPDHKLKDMSVLELVPRPWHLTEVDSKQQITTFWWTQNLTPDNEVLKELPIETTIRVRAYPDHSIKRHVEGGRPVTEPPDVAPQAIREIPLRLGLRRWKARLVTPNEKEPPVLLDTESPWEDGFEVEIEILDNSNPADIHYLKNEDVQWKLLPSLDGQVSGGVKDGSGMAVTKGVWKTDGSGHVKFRFCPKKENSLFLYQEKGVTFRAEFELHQIGKSEDTPGPKIRSIEKPEDEQAPSFWFDWAPKFDLGIFKLPFFIKPDVVLDLKPEPSEENAAPVPLTLTPEKTHDYRMVFRTGGRVTLQPTAPWDDKGGNKKNYALKYFQFVVGDRTGEKPRRIAVEPGHEMEWPETVIIPVPPNQSGGGVVELKPSVALHPDVQSILKRIIEESAALEKGCSTSAVLEKHGLARDIGVDFAKLGQTFAPAAVEFFAETPQLDLVEKRKALYNTLVQMPPFLAETLHAWKRLGASIIFHRQAYKRFEETLITFYLDVIQWKPLKEMFAKCWKWFQGTAFGAWIDRWLTPNPIQIPNLLREWVDQIQELGFRWVVATYKKPIDAGLQRVKDQLAACAQALEQIASRRQELLHDLSEARARFSNAVDQFSTRADQFLECGQQIQEIVTAGRAAQQSKRELLEGLQNMGLVDRFNAAKTAFQQARSELKTQLSGAAGQTYGRAAREAMVVESQSLSWAARRTSFEAVSQHFENGSNELNKLITGDTKLKEAAVKKVMDQINKKPESLATVVPTAQAAGEQFINAQRDEYLQLANRVLDKVRALQRYRTTLNLPAAGPGTTIRPGQDWAATFDELQSFESQISQQTTAVQEFSATAKRFMGHHSLQAADGIWRAEKMLIDQYVKDGLKKAKARLSEDLREALDGGPGSPPKGSEGFLEEAWHLLKSCLSTVDSALDCIPSALIFRALTLLGWCLRYVLFIPLNAFFRFFERMMATLAELLISMYEWILTTNLARYALSSLKIEAITAGNQAFANGVSGLGDFFNLPYKRGLDHMKMFHDATQRFFDDTRPFDVSFDDALKNALATGYEDYYPSQLTQARSLLYTLCHSVLHEDKRILTHPPCEEDCRPIGQVAATAAESIGRYIDDYLAAGDQQSLSKKGMFQPLWSLAKDATSGKWPNSRKLELMCDWIGWLVAWFLRLAACGMAICIFFANWVPAAIAGLVGGLASVAGVETISVEALLTAASTASAISGIVRAYIVEYGFYPYSVAYPRDVLLVHGLYVAMVFKPPGERFKAASSSDILSRFR